MEIKNTGFDGLIEIYPQSFEDERGFFFESFRADKLKAAGIQEDFVQDNQSFSKKGVLRGLHLQHAPFAQGKLVRVITGRALDVVVDLRKESTTYGKIYKYLLESTKNNMLYVPEGFAHGFVALEDTIFFYKCTNVYDKASESGILYNDAELAIDWEVKNPIVSDKDLLLPTMETFEKMS